MALLFIRKWQVDYYSNIITILVKMQEIVNFPFYRLIKISSNYWRLFRFTNILCIVQGRPVRALGDA